MYSADLSMGGWDPFGFPLRGHVYRTWARWMFSTCQCHVYHVLFYIWRLTKEAMQSVWGVQGSLMLGTFAWFMGAAMHSLGDDLRTLWKVVGELL